jgi:hypothetical protein
MPLVLLIRAHVFAAERIHADDTTVPVWALGAHVARPDLPPATRLARRAQGRAASHQDEGIRRAASWRIGFIDRIDSCYFG